ncbi:acyl-CoA thioesterase [Gordonia sp. DT30]|uniref:acyl-CoA thioesterase n=1 Tax=Gordonia sp. DT30 TaxID=3416546 RepID=UPI003CF35479
MAIDTPPGDSRPAEPAAGPGAPLEIELQLRWGDMDLNAHVNNVQVSRLFEEGRVRAFGQWFTGGIDRLPVVVVRQDVEFRAPLYYSLEPVVVRQAITRVGTSSYTIGATITAADGTLCALARTTLVAVDPTTNRPTAIPQSARDILETNRADIPELRPQN